MDVFFHTKDACLRGVLIQVAIFSAEAPAFFVAIFSAHFVIISLWKHSYESLTSLQLNRQPLCDTNHAPHSPGCALGNTSHLFALPSGLRSLPCCLELCPEYRDGWKSWENVEGVKRRTFHTPWTVEAGPFWCMRLGLSRTSDYY